MSITLDDQAVDVFKLYDELAIAYSKDIGDYKALVKSIEAMIAQKEEVLQNIKNKTIRLIKNSISTPGALPAQKAALRRQVKEFNYAGVEKENLKSVKNVALNHTGVGMPHPIAALENIQEPTRRKQAPKSGRTLPKKAAGNGKVKNKKSEKPRKLPLRPGNNTDASQGGQPDASLKKVPRVKPADSAGLKCLYHPDAIASDKGRQLCSSCKWKLINSGLTNFDKEPEVISYLKGETTKFPNLGQSMCPIHPEVPSYNKKTGLCKECQKKAKGIGIPDRHLTEDELNLLRNPAL